MVQRSVMDMMVCVVGPGYVGLPLAEAFVEKMRTIGYEIVEEKAKKLAESTKTPFIVTSDPSMVEVSDKNRCPILLLIGHFSTILP